MIATISKIRHTERQVQSTIGASMIKLSRHFKSSLLALSVIGIFPFQSHAQQNPTAVEIDFIFELTAESNGFDFPDARFEGYEHSGLVDDQFIYIAGTYKNDTFGNPSADTRGAVVRVPLTGAVTANDIFFTDGGIRLFGISENAEWVCGSDSTGRAVRIDLDPVNGTFATPDTMGLDPGTVAYGVNNNGDTVGTLGIFSFIAFGGENAFTFQGRTSAPYDITQGNNTMPAGGFVPFGQPISLPRVWTVNSESDINFTDFSSISQMGLNELRAISTNGNAVGGVEGQTLQSIGQAFVGTLNDDTPVLDSVTEQRVSGSVQSISDWFDGPVFVGNSQWLGSTNNTVSFIGEGNRSTDFQTFRSSTLGITLPGSQTLSTRHITSYENPDNGSTYCAVTVFESTGTYLMLFERSLLDLGAKNFDTITGVPASLNDQPTTVDVEIFTQPGAEIMNLQTQTAMTTDSPVFAADEISFDVETEISPLKLFVTVSGVDLPQENFSEALKLIDRNGAAVELIPTSINYDTNQFMFEYNMTDQSNRDTNATSDIIGNRLIMVFEPPVASNSWIFE